MIRYCLLRRLELMICMTIILPHRSMLCEAQIMHEKPEIERPNAE